MTEQNCPHCGHEWIGHESRYGQQSACELCGCMWPRPKAEVSPPMPPPEYPYDGVISADILYEAFWLATKTLGEDESVHAMDYPYFDQEMDMVDTSGNGMPRAFWEHMARALVQ